MYSFLQQYFPICSVQVFSTSVKLKSMYFILWDATANGTASAFLGFVWCSNTTNWSMCSDLPLLWISLLSVNNDGFISHELYWLWMSAWMSAPPQTPSSTFLNLADMQPPPQLVWWGCHWVCHICWSLFKRPLSLLSDVQYLKNHCQRSPE